MNTRSPRAPILSLLVAAAGLGLPQTSRAQTETNVPTVYLDAIDSVASEAGTGPFGAATFQLLRIGPTNDALTLRLQYSGTAEAGLDYWALPAEVVIPAGARVAGIQVRPIDDDLPEARETIVATVAPSPEGAYRVADTVTNTVYIVDDDNPTNQAPAVRLLSPSTGFSARAPVSIGLFASASDPDDLVSNVQFYANAIWIGASGNSRQIDPFRAGFHWENVPPGDYDLTARATDWRGATADSDSVHVTILPAATNPAPVVTIEAAEPQAAEFGPVDGVFRVIRTGATDVDLSVHFHLSGTADAGLDYQYPGNSVIIPAGAGSAEIHVQPVNDTLVEGVETVIACLDEAPPGQIYERGSPSCAEVTIEDNGRPDPDHPPFVRIVEPEPDSVFATNVAIRITAEATNRGGPVFGVNFYAGDGQIGMQTNADVSGTRFSVDWRAFAAGDAFLVAEAFTADGRASFSAPVRIHLVDSHPADPPVVTIAARDPFAAEVARSGGPNTATFIVRRTGDTNAPLTVFYDTGGTASNGVDYAWLPGSVTIPPGRHTACIVVAPAGDTLSEPVESLVLRLTLPTTTSGSPTVAPAYALGRPAVAAAVLANTDAARPPCRFLKDGVVHLSLPATNGLAFRVESSTDLEHWQWLGTGAVIDGAVQFVDPAVAGRAFQFYRVVPDASALTADD